jgi:hypothetical protein
MAETSSAASKATAEQIIASIREFGFTNPILIGPMASLLPATVPFPSGA